MPQTRKVTNDRTPIIIVDAANVVGSRPDGWWRDRVGAAGRLLTELRDLADRLSETAEIVVVLEGAARAAAAGVDNGIRVVQASGSGDHEIVAVVAATGATSRAITVVTADRGLRERVEAYGVTTVGPRWLLNQFGPK